MCVWYYKIWKKFRGFRWQYAVGRVKGLSSWSLFCLVPNSEADRHTCGVASGDALAHIAVGGRREVGPPRTQRNHFLVAQKSELSMEK